QSEFDPKPAVALRLNRPRHQRLCVDLTPVAKAWLLADRDVLDKAFGIQRPEQTRPVKISRHDAGDVASGLALIATAAGKGRDGNRHRLDLAFGDVEPQFRRSGHR